MKSDITTLKHKIKRESSGKCNICKEEGPLSWDHIIPQGGLSVKPMEIKTIQQALNKQDLREKSHYSQNGLKLRSICKVCNSKLGHMYDTVLNNFSKDVGVILKSPLTFPPNVNIRTKPNKLIKAIIGHVLAAKLEYDSSFYDEEMRTNLFEKDEKISDKIHIFYWLYPSNIQVVMRDVCFVDFKYHYQIFFQLIKYFSIAYLVSNEKDFYGFPDLMKYWQEYDENEVDVKISLKNFLPINWPEKLEGNHALLTGQAGLHSLFAMPKS